MGITVVSIFLLQGLIFLALIFLLRQFMRDNVKNQLSHLHKLNEELIQKQNELQQQSVAAEQEYKSRMDKLEREIAEKQQQVRLEAAQTLERERQHALQEKEKIISEAVETREKMRREVMAEMEDKAIQYSRNVLEQFFTGKFRRMLHEMLTEQLIEGLESVDLSRFQIETNIANLKVTEPLGSDMIAKIEKIIQKKVRKEIQFREEIDETLMGGIILQFGSFVIDGSMINRLKESAVALKKDAHRRYQSSL